MDTVPSDLSVASVNEVGTRTSRANHFSLDPCLTRRVGRWLGVNITSGRKVGERCACMFVIRILLLQFAMNMVSHNSVT